VIPNLQISSPHWRYYFHVDGPGESSVDGSGTLLPGADAAFEHAARIIRELKELGGYDDPAYKMVVRAQDGEIVFSIPF
jgi:hypothetical protein